MLVKHSKYAQGENGFPRVSLCLLSLVKPHPAYRKLVKK